MGTARTLKRNMGRKKNKKGVNEFNTAKPVAVITSVLLVFALLVSGIYGLRLIDRANVRSMYTWDSLANSLGDLNVSIEEIDGILPAMDYLEVRKEQATENVEELGAVLGKKYKEYMLEGVQSDYFTGAALLEYSDFQTNASELMHTGELIEELYLALIGEESAVESDCVDCEMIKFIQTSYTDDYLERMINVHNMYEALIEYNKNIVELSDDDLSYFYQSEICTNTDYIESIIVDVTLIGGKALSMDEADVQYAYEKGWLPSVRLTLEDRDALDYFELYKDKDFYDSNIMTKAYVTMYSIFGESTGDTTIINLTDVIDIEAFLADLKLEVESSEEVDSVQLYTDKITYDTLSITDRLEGEQIYVVFDVVECKHTEVPDLEDIQDIVEELAINYLAEKILSETLTEMEEEHDHE